MQVPFESGTQEKKRKEGGKSDVGSVIFSRRGEKGRTAKGVAPLPMPFLTEGDLSLEKNKRGGGKKKKKKKEG